MKEKELLYGRNAVREVLRARRRRLSKVCIAAGAQETGIVGDILRLAAELGLTVERTDRRVLDKRTAGANHQGVLLEAEPYPYVELETCLHRAEERREPVLLLMLDHVQDPQNVGTLLRTAEVVGVHGVILPTRRAVGVTPAVVNTSSGATEHLAVAAVTNLAQTIVALQKAGVWVVGLEDTSDAQVFDQIDLTMPLALVIGTEGTGLARLTRERCDFVVRLPMRGQIESLNAAVAGSIMLYHVWRQRPQPVNAAEIVG